MKNISEFDQVSTANRDLARLFVLADNPFASKSQVRQVVIDLRRLLADQLLVRIASRYRIRIRLEPSDDLPPASFLRQNKCYFASSSHLTISGLHSKNMMICMTDNPSNMPWEQPTSRVKVDDYLRQNIIYFGMPIRRLQILKYLANKIGGVHLDLNRRGYEALDAMRDQLALRLENKEGVIKLTYILRVKKLNGEWAGDNWRKDFVISEDHIDPLLGEIVAICQALKKNEGVQEIFARTQSELEGAN